MLSLRYNTLKRRLRLYLQKHWTACTFQLWIQIPPKQKSAVFVYENCIWNAFSVCEEPTGVAWRCCNRTFLTEEKCVMSSLNKPN